MYETVKQLLSMEVATIISSPASLDLIKAYSKLYCNGALCRSCSEAQKEYYHQLKIDGLEKAKKYDMAQIRTCEPRHNGTIMVRNYGFVICSQMTDQVAIYLLTNNMLTESDFVKLPDGYKTKQNHVVDVVDEVIPEVAKIDQKKAAKRGRKPKN